MRMRTKNRTGLKSLDKKNRRPNGRREWSETDFGNPSLCAIITDGLDGATLFSLLALDFFLRRGGLLRDIGVSALVTAGEIGWSGLAAKIAVNALVIDVELPGHV
jgi:hypothetical protein